MDEGKAGRDGEDAGRQGSGRSGSGGETRPQRGGEAATTRFGMEEGDNTDIPAAGGPAADEDGPERAS